LVWIEAQLEAEARMPSGFLHPDSVNFFTIPSIFTPSCISDTVKKTSRTIV
jgi:hypothetical protein